MSAKSSLLAASARSIHTVTSMTNRCPATRSWS
ncbi:Uncharacterised protein [Mycobacterium tuberculosis]|nr:Uncharacterised protein [Mycobacterium tuberculosis]